MEYSLLKEINKKNLQAYLNERVFEKLYWPTFFPLKSTPFLTYETLIGSKGNRVAADVVAYDVSAPLKTRRTVSKLAGDIPSIRMKKKMTENDLNTYNILKAQASPDQQAILDLVFNDVDDVVDGVNARMEWLVFQALSKGSVSLSRTTNAGGVVTEEAIDFQLPDDNKKTASVVWTASVSTTKPITDIETVMSAAGDLGLKPRYILMNRSKWVEFRASDETKDFVAPYALYGGTRKKRAPSLAVANEALESEGLPIIVLIDTRISYEDVNHTIVSVDPWLDASGADRYVTFLEDLKCGDMLYGPIAEETNPPKQVTQAKKGNILVSKWSDVDPVAEYTKGESNVFPSWPTVDRALILDTEHTTTWGA
ncbi:MAG: major capsid protein [Dehalococcoidales bacterium]|jgi:hypothetical protein